MSFDEIAPYFGVVALSFAMSCLSTICLFRQNARIQRLQERLASVEIRPFQQIQLLAHDTGYGQAYTPAPTAPPTYYPPPPPTAVQYGTNIV